MARHPPKPPRAPTSSSRCCPAARGNRRMTGPHGALAAMPLQATWINMSTNAPAVGRELADAALTGRRAGIELGMLRRALGQSAASSAFVRHDLAALFNSDYLTSSGLDRCCEELRTLVTLAGELQVPGALTQLVESTYQRALRR